MGKVKEHISIKGIKPYYHQKVVIDELLSGTPTVVVNSSRQKGKSFLVSNLLLFYALNRPNTKNFYLAPTLKQCKSLFQIIINGVIQSGVIKSKNATDLTITFINGSVIRCLSAEQGENLRGYSSDFTCIDEAAYIADSVFYITLPWRDARNSQLLICSTPFMKNGFFYRYYIYGKNGENGCATIDWADERFKSSIEQILPPEKLEMYRKQLPKVIFERDYLGHFTDENAGVFSVEGRIKAVPITPQDKLYVGIDWANQNSGDDSVISVFNQNGNQVLIKYWNDSTPLGQISRIVKEFEPYKNQIAAIYSETNSLGEPYTEILKEKCPQLANKILGWNTSNTSKNALVVQFQTALEQGTVTLTPDEKTKDEFSYFSCTFNPTTRNVSYAAPTGLKDDCVMATLISYECMRSATQIGQYAIKFTKNNNFKVR